MKMYNQLEEIMKEDGFSSVPDVIREIVRDYLRRRETAKSVLQQEVTA
jgi:metal-responsive CopG/Arc/MetJ family transcriptional regulator